MAVKLKTAQAEETSATSSSSITEIFGVLELATQQALANTVSASESFSLETTTTSTATVKPVSVLIGVPYLTQSINYPTGCESVSATMLLNYLDVDITVDDFIEGYLAISDFEEIDGVLYAPTPNQAFIGDPSTESGYGCYAPVIVAAYQEILPSSDYAVINETRTSLSDLADTYTANGTPILIWATINMVESYETASWSVTGTDDTFTWIANEHCLVLVGYDEDYYYFNDPYNSNGIVSYEKALVEQRYAELGMQAIAVVEA
ncbi:MAG: C39 family peptidase [Actinobacteria bacterium]|nr:C39 family peptidase [Actinomycetota bacterium]